MKFSFFAALLLLSVQPLFALDPAPAPAFEVTDAWLANIANRAPENPLVAPKQKRTILIFSRMTGFKHWCTPHTANVVKILGEKSGAYRTVISDDLRHFEPENIKQYDVIVLNNTCSIGPGRHLFYDVLGDREQAKALENSLISHIKEGHGLVAIHGAIVAFNNSEQFSEMMGGSFDFHPAQQIVTGKLVDPDHPITSAFDGEPLVHVDEPYLFNKAYLDYNFHPLLRMQLEPDAPKDKRIKNLATEKDSVERYISWIKPYGKGRVFYSSPSHNAQSFEQPELLQFLLNGIQYAAGDLECDDTPLKQMSKK